MNPYDQQWLTARAAAQGQIPVDDVWRFHVQLGGTADAIAVAAYLHGMVLLDVLHRNLVSHAVNELLAGHPLIGYAPITRAEGEERHDHVPTSTPPSLPSCLPSASTGSRGPGGSRGPVWARAPYTGEWLAPSFDQEGQDPDPDPSLSAPRRWPDASWPRLITRLPDMFDPEEAEAHRLVSLKSTGLLEAGREERFDRITRLARATFNVSFAMITLITKNQQVTKSIAASSGHHHHDQHRSPKDQSFCSHTVEQDRTLVVPNATTDPRFADSPLVTGGMHIRFYAGHPLTGPGGWRIGALCIMATTPRDFTHADQRQLRVLAAITQTEISGI